MLRECAPFPGVMSVHCHDIFKSAGVAGKVKGQGGIALSFAEFKAKRIRRLMEMIHQRKSDKLMIDVDDLCDVHQGPFENIESG